jgi:hypothetical protein
MKDYSWTFQFSWGLAGNLKGDFNVPWTCNREDSSARKKHNEWCDEDILSCSLQLKAIKE